MSFLNAMKDVFAWKGKIKIVRCSPTFFHILQNATILQSLTKMFDAIPFKIPIPAFGIVCNMNNSIALFSFILSQV